MIRIVAGGAGSYARTLFQTQRSAGNPLQTIFERSISTKREIDPFYKVSNGKTYMLEAIAGGHVGMVRWSIFMGYSRIMELEAICESGVRKVDSLYQTLFDAYRNHGREKWDQIVLALCMNQTDIRLSYLFDWALARVDDPSIEGRERLGEYIIALFDLGLHPLTYTKELGALQKNLKERFLQTFLYCGVNAFDEGILWKKLGFEEMHQIVQEAHNRMYGMQAPDKILKAELELFLNQQDEEDRDP